MTTPSHQGAALRELMGENGVIAVLRANDASQYLPVLKALAAGGVRTLELTLTTPGTLTALPELLDSVDADVTIGVGTVLTSIEAQAAVDAGARFIVAPNTNPEVISTVVRQGGVMIPGAMTPTEVQLARDSGAAAVKLFPAQALGVRYFEHLRGPFPDLEVVPSGGLNTQSAIEWTKAGATAVSVGGPLVGDVFATGDHAALTARAFELTTAILESTR